MRDGDVNLVMKSSALDELSVVIARSVIVQYVSGRLPLFVKIANAFARYADIRKRGGRNKKTGRGIRIPDPLVLPVVYY